MGYLVVSVLGIVLLGFVLPIAIAVWWIGPAGQERPDRRIRGEER